MKYLLIIATIMLLYSCESKSEVKAENPEVMLINKQYNKELREADSIQFLVGENNRGIQLRIKAIKKRNLLMSKEIQQERFRERWSSK